MDYITAFDIRLSKDIYHAGENICGVVVLENSEDIYCEEIRVLLRGKAHLSPKASKSGERRSANDQYILNEKVIAWGKDKEEESENASILQHGMHQFPFDFSLPKCSMPCSLETKYGTIRYYIKVIIDIPGAVSPQGVKYFTLIGPIIDCMEEKYRYALLGQDKKVTWAGCCRHGAVALRIILHRTAYLCGENVKILAHVENRQDHAMWIKMRLTQHVEYFTEKNAADNKALATVVLQINSPVVEPYCQGRFDSDKDLPFVLPVVPPTLVGACIEDERGNEALHMEFPLTIATLPFRKANMAPPVLEYGFCSPDAEGGRYISPEFRIGQIYGGEETEYETMEAEDITIFRPLYVCIADQNSNFLEESLRDTREVKKVAPSKSISQMTLATVPEYGKSLDDLLLVVEDCSEDKSD